MIYSDYDSIPGKCRNCEHVDIYVDEGDNAFDCGTRLSKNTGLRIEVTCKLKKCIKEEEE